MIHEREIKSERIRKTTKKSISRNFFLRYILMRINCAKTPSVKSWGYSNLVLKRCSSSELILRTCGRGVPFGMFLPNTNPSVRIFQMDRESPKNQSDAFPQLFSIPSQQRSTGNFTVFLYTTLAPGTFNYTFSSAADLGLKWSHKTVLSLLSA